MRKLLLMVVLLGWTLPASAAQTFKLPIVVVPGSLTFQGQGDYAPAANPVPVTFPTSRQVVGNTAGGACSAGLVTVDANIVDGGLEASVNGYATGPGCTLGGELVFDVEMPVPEVGGSSTAVRREPSVQAFNFLDYADVTATFETEKASSATVPAFGFEGTTATALSWDGTVEPTNPPTSPTLSGYIHSMHWIPGDTLRFKVRARILMRGNSGNPAQGNVKVRWEYLVTVPEPAAALSLPIGMAWLAGLSMTRGGA
jgi:hypothetical protein